MTRRPTTRTTTAAATATVLLGVLVLGTPAPARAGGSTTSIYGGRRMGMLANLGKPDDASALFHVPAGLADQPGTQIFLFFSPAFLSTDFRMQELDPTYFPSVNPAGCGQSAGSPCPWPVDEEGYYTREIKPEKYFGVIPYLGVTQDLGFLGAKDVVVSAAVYAPNFYGAYLPKDAPTAYFVTGGFFLVISGTVGVGWRINDYVAVGASLSYNYMTITMEQKISLVHALTPPGELPNQTALSANALLGDLTFGFSGVDHGVGWGASVLVNPLPWIGIGVAYGGSTPSRFEGDLSFSVESDNVEDEQQLRDLVGVLNYKLPRRLTLEMPLPHTLAAGINLALGKRVELGFDLRLWFYNTFDTQVLTPHYDPNEKGQEPMTQESLSREKNYTLSYQFSLGMLVRPFRKLMGLEAMWGFGYDQSPVPDETYSLDNPNLSHLKFTLGLRYQVNHSWRLSAGYLLNLYIPRDIRNSQTDPPTNVQVRSHSHSPSLAVHYIF